MYSRKFVIENGTPQGSIVSPLIFYIMINDVFAEVESRIGFSLFADDGTSGRGGETWSSL